MEGKTIAMGSQIELSVPAAKEMMLVIRLTTAAVMARSGISADSMDDMKMAVEEAANCLMQTSCLSSIQLRFERTLNGTAVTLCGVPTEREDCSERQKRAISEDEIAVARCILETMADEVDIVEENGSIRTIGLLKNIPNK